MKTVTQDDFKKMYGEVTLNNLQIEAKEPGYLSRVGSELKASYQGLQKTTERGAELMGEGKAVEGAVMSGLGAPAAAVRAAFSPITAALSPLIESGLKATGVTENETVQNTLAGLDTWAKAHPDAAENLKNIFEIGSTVGVGKIATAVKPALERGVKTGVETTMGAVKTGVDTSKRATAKIIKAVEPKPLAPTEAVGQVLQGKTGDIPAGVKGLSTLDTTGVKTYSELGTKIKDRIGELAKKVDEDLGVDQTKRALKDLTISGKTTSGKVVKMKPIDDALSQLDELYTKTGDKLSSANIKELAVKAKNEGLTDLEVNDIARVYGSEFKDKAFSKLGEPLTSVNAQMYENTRTSLKEIARRGIKGAEAKTADKQMSALYKTQALIQKNVEAVNKLQQRIQERGLLEKVGHSVSKYADVLTGGSIRGFVGGLLPRGAGYKVLNALDLEKALEKNLQIIQKAIKSGDDEELLKLIKSIGT